METRETGNDAISRGDLIRRLREAAFCRPAIEELSGLLGDLTPETAAPLIEQLIEQGEDVALDRLLCVCAFKGLALDPAVLVGSAAVIADILHLPFCIALQGVEVIGPLIEAARSDELSWERQAVLARLAAELALRHDTSRDEAKRLVQWLGVRITTPPTSILLDDSLRMLETGKLEAGAFPLLSEIEIRTDLPERRPPTVIGGGETIRRPVPKRGRNEACHCGSGKKYKRCCLERDRALLADASPHEGITRTQIQENPGIIDDPGVIHGLRSYEVMKLEPGKLAPAQLVAAYQRATAFGLLEMALAMLEERSARTDAPPMDDGHFIDLMEAALDRDNLEIARRALEHVPETDRYLDDEELKLQFGLAEDPGLVETLEARCRKALCRTADDEPGSNGHLLCDLTHQLHRRFPALSILFARAAVQERPEFVLDNVTLQDVVHETRSELGLDPWDDPIDASIERNEETLEGRELDRAKAMEAQSLRDQLADAGEQIREAERSLAEREAALRKLQGELDTMTAAHREEVPAERPSEPARATAGEALARYRRQIENMKAEISSKQEEKRLLTRELERERRRSRQLQAPRHSRPQGPAPTDDPVPEIPVETARPILIPEYDSGFRHACRKGNPSLAASALKAVTAFAAYDSSVWRHSRGIRKLANVYRVRINRSYRLLLRWVPGQSLTALDLIHRRDLEAWIKRHC